MANHTLSQCTDPKYVFQSFDNLGNCYNAAGDTLAINFTNVVEKCLNDYCKNPYPDLGVGIGMARHPFHFLSAPRRAANTSGTMLPALGSVMR